MDTITTWAVTIFAAKMMADPLRRTYGYATPNVIASATRSIETDAAFGIAFAAALFVTLHIGLPAALIVAILFRIGALVGDRVLLPGNHTYLELFVATVCLRLLDRPQELACVLQVATASVWMYSVYQKLYQREFHDGAFFYLTMQDPRWSIGGWTKYLHRVPPLTGDYGPIDPASLTFCRRLALLVMATEGLTPIAAFAMSGTIWSPLLLLAISLPVGLLTSETNFMITNLLLAAMFLVPFSLSSLQSAMSDPLVAAIVIWLLVWPPVHAALARRLRFSPWKLAGWGMYSRQEARVDIVSGPDARLTPIWGPAIPARLLREFGACRIEWLRATIHRIFFRWGHRGPADAVMFRWFRRRGDRFVTECVVLRRTPDADPRTFEVGDAASASELQRYLASLSTRPHSSLHAQPPVPVPGMPGGTAEAGAKPASV